MKKEEKFRRRCEEHAMIINRVLLIFVSNIRYKELLHNVYYEKGNCYCDSQSERMMKCSDIEICRYKNRIQVTMLLANRNTLTNCQKKIINKILRTNVQYKILPSGYTEIIFNVNPHKM